MSTFSTRARHASCRVHTLAVAGSRLQYLIGRFSVLMMPGAEFEYNIALLEDMSGLLRLVDMLMLEMHVL